MSRIRIILVAALVLVGSVAWAGPPAIELPPGTTALAPGPGAEIARGQCLICHSADFITTQPPQADRAFWIAELDKMKKLGAPFTSVQRPVLLDYLVHGYGNEKGSVSAAVAALVRVAAQPATEPHALAETSGCFACHALDQTRVGPAFEAIAARYSGQRDASAKLVAKIKSGVGVWGAVPMPPQDQLAESDLKRVVAWILGLH